MPKYPYILYLLRTQTQGTASPGSSFSRLHMSTLFKNLSPVQRTAPQTNIPNVDVTEQPETWRSQTFLQVMAEVSFLENKDFSLHFLEMNQHSVFQNCDLLLKNQS